MISVEQWHRQNRHFSRGMSHLGIKFIGVAAALAWLTPALASSDPGVEFFEKRIRPLFAERCYECHSAQAEKLKGGLHLDSKDGVLKGGDSGPAIVPGNPEKSLLIKAVRYASDDLQMPPKNKKLSDEQIADLEEWVKLGAPDPRTAEGARASARGSASDHWAFQPIKSVALPKVRNSRWIQSPVDTFILAKLEQNGITPNPPADKRTMIRRASFDLIGLPPKPQDVDAFIADKSPQAFDRVIERLLNSPHYGERWGRYWLDIARYADTKGYVFEEERRYAFAYTYRDYVIRAFNEDLPFDRFLIEQIAADLLSLGDDKRSLAALGYLTLGRRFLNNQSDIIDDRIDVVTRGMLGLTVSCARCHDHKYDPIPTKDYYSLYGVFQSCNEPRDKPLLGTVALPPQYPEYVKDLEKRKKELDDFREQKETEVRTKLHSQVGDYLLVVHESTRADGDKRESLARERKLSPNVAARWRSTLEKGTNNLIFAKWFAAVESKSSEKIKEAAQHYNKTFADADKQWRELIAKDKTAKALPDTEAEALRQVLYGPDAPTEIEGRALTRLLDTPAQQKIRALQRKVDELDATHPGAPPRAMALADNSSPSTPRVFVRGNPNNPGAEVPRQFLGLIAGENRKPFERGSGRLELAESIASRDNPLTARVLVNRVWMYHFAAPLVRTPSDFGLRSEPPSHPELLDYLAWQFMNQGWSLKKLHRMIMSSSSYQQSSANNPEAAKVDQQNQLVWRMNRRRLDFESMRDTFLAVAGKIDLTMGGRPVELTSEPFPARRTIYGFVERQNLPGLFRTFDFASPDTTSPQRFSTTVPQQALFLMNSPFLVQQAKDLAHRPEIQAAKNDDERARWLYRSAFNRDPEADELKLAKEFVVEQEREYAATNEPAVWQYGYGAKEFKILPHYTGYAWQGGKDLPDSQLGWVLLTAEGGHPGDTEHPAVRRWHASIEGTISITGELHHPSDKGDGVRARIISSRKGVLGEWTAQNGKTPVNVERVEIKPGDYIDFVTDCRSTIEHDSFNWAPVIKARSGDWSAKTDFAGPPREKPKRLGSWEKYAQVLLLANELMFVD
jgi:mono/diheme cytochrome c family protein